MTPSAPHLRFLILSFQQGCPCLLSSCRPYPVLFVRRRPCSTHNSRRHHRRTATRHGGTVASRINIPRSTYALRTSRLGGWTRKLGHAVSSVRFRVQVRKENRALTGWLCSAAVETTSRAKALLGLMQKSGNAMWGKEMLGRLDEAVQRCSDREVGRPSSAMAWCMLIATFCVQQYHHISSTPPVDKNSPSRRRVCLSLLAPKPLHDRAHHSSASTHHQRLLTFRLRPAR